MTESFTALTNAVDTLLHECKYSTHTISSYHRFWNRIGDFMDGKSFSDFSYDVGELYFRETYGYSLKEPSTTYSSDIRHCHRTIMVLVEFQKSGTIYRRKAAKNHDFEPCFQPAISEFMDIITETMARTSRRQFQGHMENFLGYLFRSGCQDLTSITRSNILGFWETRSHVCKTTREYDAYVLRKFLGFLYERGYTKTDNSVFVPNIKGNHKGRIPSYCTTAEITKLLSAVDRVSPIGKRDFAILLLAVRYGMRVGDIRNLKLSDFDWSKSSISFVLSKTGVRTTLPLLDDVATAMIDYFKNGRPDTSCKNVFVRHNAPYDEFGKDDNLHYIISKYMHLAGFTDLHHRKHGLYTLRHSLAGNMLDMGTPLSTISEIYDHSSSDTTMIYTKIGINQLQGCALEVG